MSVTTYWAPNQTSIAQVETYTFTAPNGAGNTYTATINGKSVTYSANATDGLTAAAAATGLFNLLNVTTNISPEFTEITWTNPSSGQLVATATVPGTPFANITINGVAGQGLVMSTGNGLANGITTAHTTANASPSDVNDPQNWLRTNLSNTPPSQTRAIPVNGDDVLVNNTSVPMLWNLDRLSAVQFNTYRRDQSFTGTIGLPENNPLGYVEWRATYFTFVGPQGSVPSGGLQIVLGFNTGNGSGPTRERYNLQSQKYTLNAIGAGSPADEWGIRILGVHTDNAITAKNGVSVGVAMLANETAQLNSVTVDGATVGIGKGVTWTTAISGGTSALTAFGGTLILNAAPAALNLNSGAQATFATDTLTWTAITAQGGSSMTWLAGGTITTLTMSVGCTLDKSQDARTLTITNSTIDGDSCQFIDPDNAIVWTNATSVKQQVTTGPFQFTGTRTVKVT